MLLRSVENSIVISHNSDFRQLLFFRYLLGDSLRAKALSRLSAHFHPPPAAAGSGSCPSAKTKKPYTRYDFSFWYLLGDSNP